MSELESTARRLFREVPIEVPPGLREDATRRAARIVRRRRATVGTALAAVLAVIALVAVAVAATGQTDQKLRTVDSTTTTTEPGPPVGKWRDIADGPLTPRIKALNGLMGDEIAFVGGATDAACSNGADCFVGDEPDESLGIRDAAIYDPATDTWRAMAKPPKPMSSYEQQAWAGGRLLITRQTDLLVYDPETDRWSHSSPLPPSLRTGPLNGPVDMNGSYVVAPYFHQAGQPMVTYDPVADAWAELPADPIGPAFGRTLLWTGSTLVLVGAGSPDEQNGAAPARIATYDPGTRRWTRLPDAPLGEDGSFWYSIDEGHIATAVERDGILTASTRSGVVDLRTGAVSALPTVTPPGESQAFVVGPGLAEMSTGEPQWHRLMTAHPARGTWLYSPASQRFHHVPSPVSPEEKQVFGDVVGFLVGRDLVMWRGLIEERGIVEGLHFAYRLPPP